MLTTSSVLQGLNELMDGMNHLMVGQDELERTCESIEVVNSTLQNYRSDAHDVC